MTKYYILYRYCLVQVNALQYGQIHLRNHALYLQPHTSNATPIFFPSPHSIIMPFYPHFFPFLSPFLTPTYPPPPSPLSPFLLLYTLLLSPPPYLPPILSLYPLLTLPLSLPLSSPLPPTHNLPAEDLHLGGITPKPLRLNKRANIRAKFTQYTFRYKILRILWSIIYGWGLSRY